MVIIARFAHRRDLRAHGDHKAVVASAADIFPLQRSGGRQNDIGKFGLRGPELLVYDYRFRPPPGAQAVKILMMMKRVAARPVDEANIGIAQMLAVKLVRFTRCSRYRRDAPLESRCSRRYPRQEDAVRKGFPRRSCQIGTGVAKS